MDTQTYSKCKYCNEPIGKYEGRCKYCASLIDWEEAQPEQASSKDNLEDNVNDAQRNDLVRGQDFVLVNYTPPAVEDKNIAGIDGHNNNINAASKKVYPNSKSFIKNKKVLSNTAKVWLATVCSIFPFVGQIVGLILSISYINSNDPDRRSYGSALLIPSVVIFVLNMFIFFVVIALMLPS